jgi:hypothetical protein
MIASLVEVAGVVGGADGDGASLGAAVADVDSAAEGWTEASADGAADGDGDAAAVTVNVVVPWSRSPSCAEAEIQRTV